MYQGILFCTVLYNFLLVTSIESVFVYIEWKLDKSDVNLRGLSC